MCGGFSCSKNALAFLNILFLLVSLLLIGVAAYAKAAAVIVSMEIAGGIIACGLFLFLVAVLGLYAGAKHHQVFLFFYIVILFLLFIIQFSVSIACLALSEPQVSDVLEKFWNSTTDSKENALKQDAQTTFKCCAWTSHSWNKTVLENCVEKKYCTSPVVNSTVVDEVKGCSACKDVIPKLVSAALEATGGIGMFFSFTEMLGVWLAVRYRNQKDPSANPSQFL